MNKKDRPSSCIARGKYTQLRFEAKNEKDTVPLWCLPYRVYDRQTDLLQMKIFAMTMAKPQRYQFCRPSVSRPVNLAITREQCNHSTTVLYLLRPNPNLKAKNHDCGYLGNNGSDIRRLDFSEDRLV